VVAVVSRRIIAQRRASGSYVAAGIITAMMCAGTSAATIRTDKGSWRNTRRGNSRTVLPCIVIDSVDGIYVLSVR
jgi:hypothetical protein